jgi:hypothetical protein
MHGASQREKAELELSELAKAIPVAALALLAHLKLRRPRRELLVVRIVHDSPVPVCDLEHGFPLARPAQDLLQVQLFADQQTIHLSMKVRLHRRVQGDCLDGTRHDHDGCRSSSSTAISTIATHDAHVLHRKPIAKLDRAGRSHGE